MIKIKQQSLKYLLDQKVGTPMQQRWITKLLDYDFLVEYKNKIENRVANSLSQKIKEKSTVM